MAEPVYGTTTDLANLSMLSAATLALIPLQAQNAALAARSRWADGFLRAKFVLPLVAWGQDLTRVVVDAAAYDLATQRGMNPEAGADVNFRLKYEDAERWLHRVAEPDGGITPDLTDSSMAAAAGVAQRPRVQSSSQRGWSTRKTPNNGGSGPFTGD